MNNRMKPLAPIPPGEEELFQWSPLFDATHEMISVHLIDGSLVYANKEFYDILGCRLSDNSKSCFHLVHQTGSPCPVCPCKVMVETKRPATAELYEPTLDKHLEIWVHPLIGTEGAVVGYVHVVRDISRHKQLTYELLSYRSAMDDASDPIMLTDLEGRATYLNLAFSYLSGIPGRDLEKVDVSTMHYEASITEKILAQVRDGGCWKGEIKVNGRDGRTIACELRCSAILDNDDSDICGLMWLYTDITARLQADRDRQDKEKLQAVLETTGAVSHELNQPLMVFSGYVDLLKKLLPEEGKPAKYVRAMWQQVERMRDISKDLSRITRYVTTDYVDGVQIIDLKKAAEEVPFEETSSVESK